MRLGNVMINIEKVAKAIFDSRGYKTTWLELNNGMKAEYKKLAKAAVAEIGKQQMKQLEGEKHDKVG